MVSMEEICDSVRRGRTKEVEARIREAVAQGIRPKTIVEEALLPAMRQITEDSPEEQDGDIMKILCTARGMRVGMDILEPMMEPEEAPGSLGTVILGTAAGDLHDVGKNLVGITLRSVGFEVIDLGVDISGRQFLKALKDHPEAGMVCISALLSTSLPEVKKMVASIRRADPKHRVKIMVGGGAVTQDFADSIGADAYTENAVEAATLARKMMAGESPDR